MSKDFEVIKRDEIPRRNRGGIGRVLPRTQALIDLPIDEALFVPGGRGWFGGAQRTLRKRGLRLCLRAMTRNKVKGYGAWTVPITESRGTMTPGQVRAALTPRTPLKDTPDDKL